MKKDLPWSIRKVLLHRFMGWNGPELDLFEVPRGTKSPFWPLPYSTVYVFCVSFIQNTHEIHNEYPLKYTKWLHLFPNGPLLCIQRILKYAIVYSTDLLCILLCISRFWPCISPNPTTTVLQLAHCYYFFIRFILILWCWMTKRGGCNSFNNRGRFLLHCHFYFPTRSIRFN